MERQGWSWESQEPHKFSLGNSIIRGAGKRGTRCVRSATPPCGGTHIRAARVDGYALAHPASRPLLPFPPSPRASSVKQYGDNFAVARKGIPIWPGR